MKTVICLALLVVLPAAALAQTQPSSVVVLTERGKTFTAFQQSMIEAEKAFLTAVERGDRQYVEHAVAQDFLAVDSNGSTSNRADLIESVRPSTVPKTGKEEKPILYFFEVVPLNDSAAVVSYDAVRPGDHPRYVHISDTWVKQEGQWTLKFSQSTPNIWSAADLD